MLFIEEVILFWRDLLSGLEIDSGDQEVQGRSTFFLELYHFRSIYYGVDKHISALSAGLDDSGIGPSADSRTHGQSGARSYRGSPEAVPVVESRGKALREEDKVPLEADDIL
jgi:hypothetical protein